MSKYGGESPLYVTPAQYLTELLCERIAKQKGHDLPIKFWELPNWSKLFRRHIGEANKILRSHTIHDVLEVLKDKSLNRMQSFRFPPFIKLLSLHSKTTPNSEIEELAREVNIHEQTAPPTVFSPANSLGKLRSI